MKQIKTTRIYDPKTVGIINKYRKQTNIRSGVNAAEELIKLGYETFLKKKEN